jgi:NAD-dependent SIR2 family protein deacetylase
MESFRQILKESKNILILTGAGISAESGNKYWINLKFL